MHLNRDAVLGIPSSSQLLPSYSHKSLNIKNVAAGDAWYVPDENSVMESHVLPPENVYKVGETSTALAKIGAGKFGYVGDVNGEVGSDAVILAMCGL